MREALIVWGGWSGHEPQECAEIIKTMLEEDGFKVYLEHGTGPLPTLPSMISTLSCRS